eukprot:3561185-Rhodomonas_salina.1
MGKGGGQRSRDEEQLGRAVGTGRESDGQGTSYDHTHAQAYRSLINGHPEHIAAVDGLEDIACLDAASPGQRAWRKPSHLRARSA